MIKRHRSVLHCSQVLAWPPLFSKLPVNGPSTHSRGTALRERSLQLVHGAESGLCSLHPFTYREGQEQKLVEEQGVFESSAWLYGFPDLPEEPKVLGQAGCWFLCPANLSLFLLACAVLRHWRSSLHLSAYFTPPLQQPCSIIISQREYLAPSLRGTQHRGGK